MKPKNGFTKWIDQQLDQDPALATMVEHTLNELRLEQDLIALREARGLSQSQLAKLLKVSQPAIAKIESGQYKNLQLRTLIRMATALQGHVMIKILKAESQDRRKATHREQLVGA